MIDRHGGTHIGRCLGALLATPSGNAIRGAVVVIASDGWDSDAPELLARAMARIRRRPRRVRVPADHRCDGGRPAVLRHDDARAHAGGDTRVRASSGITGDAR
ncbi:VWA domain-containing protein [Nocardia sp. R7R-8]|uniref:VWA domain-containing protein n=1 Tax=Nocardia sp. R7R-8 TaxID=3459304 RepID=UPI00403E0B10